MKQLDIKKLLFQNFPYVFLLWFFNRVGEGWRWAVGTDVVEKAMGMVSGLGQLITRRPLPSLHPQDLLVGLIGAAAARVTVYLKAQNARKYRRGAEYPTLQFHSKSTTSPYQNQTENIQHGEVFHCTAPNYNSLIFQYF